jgi:hypothetical protein
MGYSEARGTLIYEKNLMSKISCQTPFKGAQVWIFERLDFHDFYTLQPFRVVDGGRHANVFW